MIDTYPISAEIRKDEKYLFLYNEVEQDFVDFFFFFLF